MHTQSFGVRTGMGIDPVVFEGKNKADFALQFPLSILVADDSAINRRVLCLFLKGLGYQADTAEDGLECLNIVLERHYDLLISDIDMPNMNGIECAQRIREAGIDIQIVAVTATSPLLTRSQCFEAGMNDYMTKPINFLELKCKLQEISKQRLHHVP